MATNRNNDRQGFNSGKSLKEQVKDIMTEKTTNSVKRNKLVKLGLSRDEVEILFASFSKMTEISDFDFSKLTFGVEIECYNFERRSLIDASRSNGLQVRSEDYNHADNNYYYKIVSDASLDGENSQEVVSPILQGNNGLSSLEKICTALALINARVNRSCGLHVHIGAASMSDAHYCRLVRNYQKLEMAIDTFMPESRRGNNSRWCHSFSGIDFSRCTTKRSIYEAMNGDRYYKVNAVAYSCHRTIEFRQHSGTTDYQKISNWVMFLAKLVEYSYKNELASHVTCIEDIPFLSKEQKMYFTGRRNQLDRAAL